MNKIIAQQLEGSYQQLQNIFGLAVKKLTEGYIAAVAKGERPIFKGGDDFENLTEWKQTSVIRFRSGNSGTSDGMNIALEIELRGLRSAEGSALTDVSISRRYAADRHDMGFVSGQWGWQVMAHRPFKDNAVSGTPVVQSRAGAVIDSGILSKPPETDQTRVMIELNTMFEPYGTEEIMDHVEIANKIAEMAIIDLPFLHEKKEA